MDQSGDGHPMVPLTNYQPINFTNNGYTDKSYNREEYVDRKGVAGADLHESTNLYDRYSDPNYQPPNDDNSINNFQLGLGAFMIGHNAKETVFSFAQRYGNLGSGVTNYAKLTRWLGIIGGAVGVGFSINEARNSYLSGNINYWAISDAFVGGTTLGFAIVYSNPYTGIAGTAYFGIRFFMDASKAGVTNKGKE